MARHLPTPSHRMRVAAGAALFVVGLTAVCVGVPDAATTEALGARLLGLLLVIAGVAAAAAAVVAVRSEQYVLGALACVVGGSFGAFMLLASKPDFGLTPLGRPLAWWTVIGLSLAALAVFLLAVAARGPVCEELWQRKHAAASVLSLGALVALGSFLHSAVYLPSLVPASLSVEMAISEGTTRGGLTRLDLDITVRNPTTRRAAVAASGFWLTGSRVRRSAGLRDEDYPRRVLALSDRLGARQPVVRDYAENGADLLATALIFPEGWHFDPGEDYRTRRVVFVPAGRYDVVRLNSLIWAAKGDLLVPARTPMRDETREFAPGPLGGMAPLHVGAQIQVIDRRLEGTSVLAGLTQGERFVRFVREVREGEGLQDVGVTMQVSLEREGRAVRLGQDGYNHHLADRYGLESTWTVAERGLAARRRPSEEPPAPPRIGRLLRAALERLPGVDPTATLGPRPGSIRIVRSGGELWARATFERRYVGPYRVWFHRRGSGPWIALDGCVNGPSPGFGNVLPGVPNDDVGFAGLLRPWRDVADRHGLRHAPEPIVHPGAAGMVDGLYGTRNATSSGCVWTGSAERARTRLARETFDAGAVWDARNGDGSLQLRGYVMRFRHPARAADEVAPSLGEISPLVPVFLTTKRGGLEGVPGGGEVEGEGLLEDGTRWRVLHLIVPVPRLGLVYGLQARAIGATPVPKAELLEAARRLSDLAAT